MSNTAENNRLIAEFIEMDKTEQGDYLYIDPFGNETICDDENFTLAFDESWDWIMKAVEKIAGQGHEVNINWNVCDGGYLSCKIDCYESEDQLVREIYRDDSTVMESTYNAVVEFINWYNSSSGKA